MLSSKPVSFEFQDKGGAEECEHDQAKGKEKESMCGGLLCVRGLSWVFCGHFFFPLKFYNAMAEAL